MVSCWEIALWLIFLANQVARKGLLVRSPLEEQKLVPFSFFHNLSILEIKLDLVQRAAYEQLWHFVNGISFQWRDVTLHTHKLRIYWCTMMHSGYRFPFLLKNLFFPLVALSENTPFRCIRSCSRFRVGNELNDYRSNSRGRIGIPSWNILLFK